MIKGDIYLVTFEQAKALKELGFPQKQFVDTYCYAKDGNLWSMLSQVVECIAPDIYRAAKWLRKEKSLFIHIDMDFKTQEYKAEVCKFNGMTCHVGYFKEYEDALYQSIDKSINIIKKDETKTNTKENKTRSL